MQYILTFMSSEKSVGVSFRVTPKFKSLLEAAARREQRSLTNMLEVLLYEYCKHHGIDEAVVMTGGTKGEDK
jgi:hypothetical protein